MFKLLALFLVLPASQGAFRQLHDNPTCTADLNQLNQDIGDDLVPVSTWNLKTLTLGSVSWSNNGWSAASKTAMDNKCRSKNAKRCEISMCLLFKTATSTLIQYMEPYTMICRPNSCQASTFWRSAIQSIGKNQGANGFFWEARDDQIAIGCSLNPSLCTFEFEVCGEKIRFPYDPATVSSIQVANDSTGTDTSTDTGSSTGSGTETSTGSTGSGATTDGSTGNTDGSTTDGSTTDGSTGTGSGATTDGSTGNTDGSSGNTDGSTGTGSGATTDGSTDSTDGSTTDNTTDDTEPIGENNGQVENEDSSTEDDGGLARTTVALIIVGGLAAVISIGIAAKSWHKGKGEGPAFEQYE